jgi:hypothetical protein
MAIRALDPIKSKNLRRAVFRSAFCFAALGSASSAFAGAGIITTTVTSQSSNITYSTPATTSPARAAMPTYVGYLVTIGSDATNTNTINNVRFTATASVTDPAEKATFWRADGATCNTTANPLGTANPGINDGTSIECSIGQLRAGETFPTFAVFFKAPEKVDLNGQGDTQGSDFVSLSGITYYAEGTGGPNSTPINSTNTWPVPVPIELGTCNPNSVKSGLPKSGGTFFTGGAAGACPVDPFAVSVNAPNPPVFSTVELSESDITAQTTCTSLGNFVQCFQAQVTIPLVVYKDTSGPYLTIVLRVLAGNIKPGTKISSVLIQYVDDSDPLNPVTYPLTQPLRSCPKVGNQMVPTFDGIPCVAKVIYYKNKSVPGWTPELDGAFEWYLLNDRNGGYRVF